MNGGKGKDVLGDVLKKLVNYCGMHFATEERVFKNKDYPDYQAHKDKHEKMTAKVLSLQNEFQAGNATITHDVSNFLRDWLNKHILGTDKKYSEYLNSLGVT